MKKILIPLLGTALLSIAHPSLATFSNQYGSQDGGFDPSEYQFSYSSAKSGHKSNAKDGKDNDKESGKSSPKASGWPSLNRSAISGEREIVSNAPANTPRKPRSWQGVRPADYNADDRSDDEKSSRGSKGGSSNKSSGSKGGSRGSSGSSGKNSKHERKSGQWLSKEDKRDKQLDAFKQRLHDKQKHNSKAGSSKKYTPHQWSKHEFKQYDHSYWSRDDFKKAMHCWLAPHMHEDKEFVNRHWKNWGHKWKWMSKHHKHKWKKPKPDKPSEVPLPATAILFGSALLGLATIGGRRSKSI